MSDTWVNRLFLIVLSCGSILIAGVLIGDCGWRHDAVSECYAAGGMMEANPDGHGWICVEPQP